MKEKINIKLGEIGCLAAIPVLIIAGIVGLVGAIVALVFAFIAAICGVPIASVKIATDYIANLFKSATKTATKRR